MTKAKQPNTYKPDSLGIFDPGPNNTATIRTLLRNGQTKKEIAKATGLSDAEIQTVIDVEPRR